MTNLNQLSLPALKAAMQGGTDGWGLVGSAAKNVRYCEPLPKKSRKKCHCGCENRKTHRGMANGMCLISACHMGVLRWVKTGSVKAISKAVLGEKP